MLEFLRDAFHLLTDIKGLLQWGGTFMVCAIVFVETGLFVGFFLPGDSLLVTAGIFAAAGHLDIRLLLSLVFLCAFGGDQLGYWIGSDKLARLCTNERIPFCSRNVTWKELMNFMKDTAGRRL